ncbi:MAG: D-alanyl-D-alanine carboxypeptidase [Oscillospiraceae bacterium]|nr:D-alanyl-D-alanine carboxypeptidase [Oscillospiraceae bacterium]
MKPKCRLLALFAAVALSIPLFSFGANAAFNTLLSDVPGITNVSEIVLLQSLDDGMVIFEKNADTPTAPASLTKITTAILTMESIKDLDTPVTAKAYCIRMFDGTGSSNAGIKPGEILTVRDLLYCLMLPSANEAAAILADFVGGSIEAFVQKMNDFAAALGCENTHFKNPHGLDEDGHFTTARDLAKITSYAYSAVFGQAALFEQIVTTLRYEIPPTNMRETKRILLNTNRMMNAAVPDYYSPDVRGVKTGTTDNAGDCVVAKATKNGYNYLCIVLKGQKVNVDKDETLENTAFIDAKALFNWAFDNLRLRQVTQKGQVVATVPIALGREADTLQLAPAESLSFLVPKGLNADSVLVEVIPDTVPKDLMAPLSEGDFVCKGKLLFAGKEFATIDLYAAATVRRSAALYAAWLAKKMVASLLFKAICAIALLLCAIIAFAALLRTIKRSREKQMRVLPTISNPKK